MSLQQAVESALIPIGTDGTSDLKSLRLAWPNYCGQELSGHTQPVEIDADILVLDVADQAWLEAFEAIQGRILHRVQRGFPQIRAFEARLNPLSIPAIPTSGSSIRRPSQPDASENIEHAISRLLEASSSSMERT